MKDYQLYGILGAIWFAPHASAFVGIGSGILLLGMMIYKISKEQ